MAGRNSAAAATEVRNICSRSSSSLSEPPVNGPAPVNAAPTAMAVITTAIHFTPGDPSHATASSSRGKMPNKNPWPFGIRKTSPPTSVVIISRRKNLKNSVAFQSLASFTASNAGINISAPNASPTHHVSQTGVAFIQGKSPLHPRLTTPKVALTNGATTAAATKLNGWVTLPNRLEFRFSPMTMSAPTMASSVLPAPMPSAANFEIGVSALPTNAPSAMPGHSRTPKSSSAPMATPVAGQTGETFPWMLASSRPSLAVPT